MAIIWKQVVGWEGTDYFEWFNTGPSIGKKILSELGKSIEIQNIYALCEENTPNDKLLLFSSGFLPEYSLNYNFDSTAELLESKIPNIKNTVYICEDCAYDVQQAEIHDIKIPYLYDQSGKFAYLYYDKNYSDTPFKLYEDEIEIVFIIIYFLEEHAESRFRTFPKELNNEDIDSIVQNLKQIIMNAYDDESYIKLEIKKISK